jgi:hypothetical protein
MYGNTIHVLYNGCDPFESTTDADWLSIQKVNSELLVAECAVNPSNEDRMGNLVITSGNAADTLDVIQMGMPQTMNILLSHLPLSVTGGDQVEITVEVLNGEPPYSYHWERWDANIGEWITVVERIEKAESTDSITLTAGNQDIEVRCTVSSLAGKKTSTIVIRVIQ